jgi:epsilon-lactone hydrolase
MSFRSRLVNLLLRNRHLLQGKRRKETFTSPGVIPGFRDQCERGASRFGKVPDGVTVRPQVIAGIPAEFLEPEGSDPSKIILYVHGGGYVSGSCNDHRAIVAKFARNTGFTCLVYEYGLAPEKPFPAAVDDSVAVYRWLTENGYLPGNILLAGESAGGGLVLALLLAMKERGLPLPVAAVSISPWTDLTCSSDTYRTKNKYSLAPVNSWFVFGAAYMGGHDPKDPLISPLFGNLEGLPPLLINAGSDDELFDDGRLFAEKARAAGVDVLFRAGDRQVHCYPLLAPMFPEAVEAMNEIVNFIQTKLQ